MFCSCWFCLLCQRTYRFWLRATEAEWQNKESMAWSRTTSIRCLLCIIYWIFNVLKKKVLKQQQQQKHCMCLFILFRHIFIQISNKSRKRYDIFISPLPWVALRVYGSFLLLWFNLADSCASQSPPPTVGWGRE